MLVIISTLIIFACFGIFAERNSCLFDKSPRRRSVILLFAAGFVLRIIFAALFKGHQTDVNDFIAWSDMLFKDGIPAFYASDSFTDYPPGYMYVLWILGFFKNAFGLSGAAELILIKLPAICADMLTGLLLYKYSKKSSLLLPALFIFNPTVILNSSIWGQVDSVVTLLMLAVIILLTEKKTLCGYFVFALAIFVKPQACMFTPLVLFAFWEIVSSDFSAQKLIKNIGAALLAMLFALVLALPFGLSNVAEQYVGTLKSYPYLTINAFNLWAAFGKNWDDVTLAANLVSTVFLAAITLVSFYILSKDKRRSRYFYTGGFICFAAFMLSVKMHERYAYPTMAMMLFAFCLSRDLRHLRLFTLFSLSQFFNTAYILFIYETDPSKYYKSPAIMLASFLNIVILLYLAYSADKLHSPLKKKPAARTRTMQKSVKLPSFSRADVIIMSVITAVYAIIAFTALGDTKAAQSEYTLTSGESVTIEFEREENVHGMKFFLGSYPLDKKRILTVSLADSGGNITKELTSDDADVFFWSTLDCENVAAASVTLSASKDVVFEEMAFTDEDGNLIKIANADSLSGLFDEQELVPEQETYMNSTYFDEIYHARTGYEFIHKLPVYEWTHPPLGKIFISIGIRLFGMTPFGWRFSGTLFGVLMLPVMYIFAKFLLRRTWLASVITISFAFDFMHFVQTRISTIDVYVTFFIMLMYLFIYVYLQKSFYDTDLKKTLLPLGLCGISTGLAIACKWTGIYAAAGVAIIFFMIIYARADEYIAAKKAPDSPENAAIIEKFPKYTIKTLLFCCIFFVIVPIAIYMLSYIPYLRANGEGIWGIWKNQTDIFTYHSKTVVESTHAYSSPWYTWPLMIRPIWYYSCSFENGFKAGISAFGNPLVWWFGIASMIFCIVLAIKNKNKTALFLIIAYAANFLPWAPVTRTTFIYHYFPSVPFVVLMNGYAIYTLAAERAWVKKAAIVYAVCVVVLFAVFYPVLAGIPMNPTYVTTFLKWLPKWVLI